MNEPRSPATPALSTVRHDGWSGEAMAIFCETLAETAVVAEACDVAGKSTHTAYALRRRNPVFAAAWDAALTIARERLADTLLARSIEGNVEQIYKDGELVGERHVIDNRLGLAILRRLDRLAETGCTVSSRGERLVSKPSIRSQPFDWQMGLDALRTGDPDALAAALAMFKANETHETHDPPNSCIEGNGEHGGDDDEDELIDFSHRCWKNDADRIWLTDFPPPQCFTGYESHPYGEKGYARYERACTPEEIAILEADIAAAKAAERAEQEELRDTWFALLKSELPDAATMENGGRGKD